MVSNCRIGVGRQRHITAQDKKREEVLRSEIQELAVKVAHECKEKIQKDIPFTFCVNKYVDNSAKGPPALQAAPKRRGPCHVKTSLHRYRSLRTNNNNND